MTDIVEQARLAAAPGGWGHANQELLGQLSDEIERLRAAVDIAGSEIDLHIDELKKSSAEIERLRAEPCPRCNDTGNARYWEARWRDEKAEIERARQEGNKLAEESIELCVKLREAAAEIEYLRSALERIRFTEGISRSVEKIALDALRRSRNGSREQKK
jgi:hypothetical protein